jgi:MFS family permease
MSPWPILALVTLGYAVAAVAALAVAPLAPLLLDALRLGRAEVGLLLPAVYLGGVTMALPAGWLTDRLGVRATLALGLLVVGLGTGLAALSWSLGSCLAFLVLGGFGFSVMNPATGRAVIEWFPPRARGVAMGIKQTGLTLGGLAGALALPPLALLLDWRRALGAAAAGAIVAAGVVALVYRTPGASAAPGAGARPRLREIGEHLRRPGVLIVLVCGLALSTAQSSVLAYLALWARETFALSPVAAGQVLALAQVGGTASRLIWGGVSDRFLGGRRRPGVVLSAAIGSGACALFALGDRLPTAVVIPLAAVVGAGTFGWVGLYFALVAEIGGSRHAGLLTGVAVAFAWSGVLVGPPVFGLVVEGSGSWTPAWLLLAAIGAAVALTLPRLRPLVQR